MFESADGSASICLQKILFFSSLQTKIVMYKSSE